MYVTDRPLSLRAKKSNEILSVYVKSLAVKPGRIDAARVDRELIDMLPGGQWWLG